MNVFDKFPGRQHEIEQLQTMLIEPSPTSLFIYGPSATGKTSIIQEIFDNKPHHAFINCIECFTPRLLFERTLHRWGYHQDRCDTLVDFVNQIQTLPPIESTWYLILDQAERLRDRGPMLLTTLLRLGELASTPICVIMVSNVIWDKFRPRHGGAPDPLQMFFSYYTKQQMLDIVVSDCPTGEPTQFFLTFVDAVYVVFHRNCMDLQELRHLVAMLYPKFVQPVYERQATRNEFARLFKLCQPYFAAASERLYLREISTSEWEKYSRIASAKDTQEDVSLSIYQMTEHQEGLELPYYTKFLLIAGFLASYNPSRLDVQYFAKGPEARKKRRRKNNDAGLGSRDRQQLLGPKAFAIERMLAIFYSIVAEPVDSAVDVQTQIASLITLRLLTKTTAGDRLDGIKCRCNVGVDMIKQVSRSVRFEVDRFLYNFS